jgi:hypothetical protein
MITGIGATLLGVAAIITAVTGIIAMMAAVRRTARETRDSVEEECLRRLRETRIEAEETARELHAIRMKQFKSWSEPE